MSEAQQILTLSRRALARGEQLCLATVVHVEGSSYRKPGARMLLTSGGERAGTISGGCLEAEVSRKAWWLTRDGSRVERYSSFADEDGGMPYGLGCGGTVSLLLEQDEPVAAVLRALELGFSALEPAVVVTVLGLNLPGTDGTDGADGPGALGAGTLAVFRLERGGREAPDDPDPCARFGLRGTTLDGEAPAGDPPSISYLRTSARPGNSTPGAGSPEALPVGKSSELSISERRNGAAHEAANRAAQEVGDTVTDLPANSFVDVAPEVLAIGLLDAVWQAFREQRSLYLAQDGAEQLEPSPTSDGSPDNREDREYPGYFIEYLAPPPALTIFGAGDDAQPIAALAHALGWRVTVADGRSHLARRERFPHAASVRVLEYADPSLRAACGIAGRGMGGIWQTPRQELLPELAGVVTKRTSSIPDRASLIPGQDSFIPDQDALLSDPVAVILTHSYEQDRALLTSLLPRELQYLGILGPRHRTERLLAEVVPGLGMTIEEGFARLHSPIGLDLGAGDPAAVALSIVSEIQALLNGRRVAIERVTRDWRPLDLRDDGPFQENRPFRESDGAPPETHMAADLHGPR